MLEVPCWLCCGHWWWDEAPYRDSRAGSEATTSSLPHLVACHPSEYKAR